LRAVDSRYRGGTLPPNSGSWHYRSAFDEYRYDALGRRVLVRSRRDCHYDPEALEGECRISKIRRTVWDGSQELWEIQMPGGDYSIHLETDVDLPVQPLDYSRATPLDPNPYFGRVAFVHGLGIDQPVAMVRMNYSGRLYANGNAAPSPHSFDPFSLSVTWNERGQAHIGTFSSDGGAMKCTGSGSTERCVNIQWPATWFAYERPKFRPNFWHGSLLHDKQEHTGQHYRRNRYYDPETARFTQEDPIGLAGGLNLYGYANGDPVNFGDPLGLNPLAAAAAAARAAAARALTFVATRSAAAGALASSARAVAEGHRPLPQAVARTFERGEYRAVTLSSDLRFHRVFGGSAEAAGRFLTTSLPSRETARQALQLPTENAATHAAEVLVKEGTTIYMGIVRGSASNAVQVFVRDLDAIRVLATAPLK
jgi:RHS repeat-associated protein